MLAQTSCREESAAPEPEQKEAVAVPGEANENPVEPAAEKKEAGTAAPKPKDAGKKPADSAKASEKTPMKESTNQPASGSNVEIATIGGGCFWCTEAVLERIEGVTDVVSGYMGGHVDNPTYEQICTKTTGHAEVIQVTFDTTKISFDEILDIFWQAHDPTTINQQGNDRGPQYRSVIYYHSPQQKNIAEKSKAKLDASGAYDDPAVTEIAEAAKFWIAEDYHQNYYEQNKDKNPYCQIVISPKMKKFGFE
jgi:peptide-methionine (S)-S-oxide reductase